MATLFTRIINREIPGRFVHEDDLSVAFLTIEPLTPGHTLVVPRAEVDHWIDLDPDTAAHLMVTAQTIGRAIQDVFEPTRVGMVIAGLEVPHVHIHVAQLNKMNDLDFKNVRKDVTDQELDDVARAIRSALG